MNPIGGQANIRKRTVIAIADGTPITVGTVNLYIHALTGTNAGKWYRDSDNSWQAAEAISKALTHVSDGHWTGSVDADCWQDGVEYLEYAKESTALHVPNSTHIRCDATVSTRGTSTLTQTQVTGGAYDVTNASCIVGADIKKVGGYLAPVLVDDADGYLLVDAAYMSGDATADAITNITSIVNRIGAWTGTGINTILGAFRALCAKAAALTPTDLSADTTFDNTTDSAEALRDRGDAAWITATGFATPTNITAASGCVLANSASHGGAAAVITLATPVVANVTQIEGSDATDQITTAANASLAASNLDHLVKSAVDTNWATTVTKNSVVDYLTSKDASQTFDRATDSQEAIRDKLPTNLEDLNITDTTGLMRPDMANASGNYAGTVATTTAVTNAVTATGVSDVKTVTDKLADMIETIP